MKFSLFSLVCFSNDSWNKSRKQSLFLERRFSFPALPEGICREFSLAEVKAATKNFHQGLIISEGGYGSVYRGTVDDGTIFVAVKRFYRSGYNQVLRREVELLCQLRHPHLVSLIGFCLTRNENILVYEYVSRGSLEDHLYGKDCVPLNWNQRLKICIGVARGLHYLHTGAKRAVVHRDIKSSNILLDDEWCCKISDFRLSKIGPRSMSKALIRMESEVQGTVGYLDPEYYQTQYISEKSDVYSFGVVLLEVLCGRPPIDIHTERDEVNLAVWACKCIENGTIYNIIDPHLKGRIAPDCFKQFVDIAFGCVRVRGNERPSMGEVETTLELALQLQNKADSDNSYGGKPMQSDGISDADSTSIADSLSKNSEE